MTTIITTNIRCDACGRDAGFRTKVDSVRAALADVREQGWKRVNNTHDGVRRKVDICGDCMKKHRAVLRPLDGTVATDVATLFEIDEDELR